MNASTETTKKSELDKWADAQQALSTLRDFLSWCSAQEIELASFTPSGHRMLPISEDQERLLARYFEIDEQKLENERRALLAKLK